jgi:hypothetical protein
LPGPVAKKDFHFRHPGFTPNRYLNSSEQRAARIVAPTVELMRQDDTVVFPIEAVYWTKLGLKIPQASFGNLN